MYNNLPQQTPYLQHPYGIAQYPRVMATQEQPFAPAQNYQPVVMQNYIKGRPVVSIDEAKASQIDLDGSLYVFPDLGNKKIYTKQINLDGTASFNVFTIEEGAGVASEAQVQTYVTRAELEKILEDFKASLTSTPQPPKSKPAAPVNFNL